MRHLRLTCQALTQHTQRTALAAPRRTDHHDSVAQSDGLMHLLNLAAKGLAQDQMLFLAHSLNHGAECVHLSVGAGAAGKHIVQERNKECQVFLQQLGRDIFPNTLQQNLVLVHTRGSRGFAGR